MTLTDQKGNIRGREFPTDTGIDGNACEETSKDQRWVGLYRQIPDTDTRLISFSLSLSLSFSSLLATLSLSLLSSLLSFSRSLALRISSPHLSFTRHSSVRPARPYTLIAALTATKPPHDVPRAQPVSTMGIRSGAVPRGNDRDGGGHRATTSLAHGPLSYDSRYFEKHQAHPYQVNIYHHRSDWWDLRYD